jgi:hypothetical protein
LYADLDAGRARRRTFDFDPSCCMALLPRAYQFVVAAAYDGHAEDEPRMIQVGNDALLDPCTIS